MRKPDFPPVGSIFTRLRVIGHDMTIHGRYTNICRCQCGKEVRVRTTDLRRLKQKSCGCLIAEIKKQPKPYKTIHGDLRHGLTKPEYRVWCGLKQRCLQPTHQSYSDYGGRGITVCDRWINGDGMRGGYECFLADMGRRPTPEHEIDRENNEGNYEPSNCRWATRQQQALNVRSNRLVEINGEILPFTEAHRRYGKSSLAAAWTRVWKGMDEVEAIVTPTKPRGWFGSHDR